MATKLAALQRLPEDALRRAASEELLDARERVLDEAKGATNSSLRLRNAGTDNVLGVELRVAADGRGGSLTAEGPWPLIEGPTKAHEIVATSGRALRLPNGPRRRVQHPGTKGKRPWAKGVESAERAAPAVLKRASDAAVQRLTR